MKTRIFYCTVYKDHTLSPISSTMSTFGNIKKNHVYPANRSSSGNNWSYTNGNPQIRFTISGVEDIYFLSRTLRLNGQLKVFQTVNNVETYPQNHDRNQSGFVQCLLNEYIGVMACIQSIQISNSNNLLIEDIQHYNRMLASMVPKTAEFGDYVLSTGTQYGASGNGDCQGNLVNEQMFFSCPIVAGAFLEGLPIPCGGPNKGTGGLEMVINLAPPSAVLFGKDASAFEYRIVNPSITFSTAYPSSGTLPTIAMQPFKSISSYYSVLNTGDQQIQLNCGLRNVISSQSNTIPTRWISDFGQDSMGTPCLLNGLDPNSTTVKAPLTRVTFLRNGVQFPLRYALTASIGTTLGGTTQENVAQIQREYLGASKPISELDRTIVGLSSEAQQGSFPRFLNNSTTPDPLSANVPPRVPYVTANSVPNTSGDGAGGFAKPFCNVGAGWGVRYDRLGTGSGADFSKQPYQMRIESRLDGDSPNSVYTFMLSQQAIVYGSGGIMIQA